MIDRLKNNRLTDFVVLAVGIAIFAVISLRNMNWSIWFDEAFGINLIKYDFGQIASYTAADVHPPLYYWLLKIWSDIFGTSELAFRSLSLILIIVAIAFGFMLLRRLFGRRAAYFGLLFMIISPMLVRYSEEARMYSLAVAITTSATYLLVSAKQASRTWKWVLYGILVSLGMWTHYFTAVVWIAHWVWHYISVVKKKMNLKQKLAAFFSREWLLAYGLAIALYVPWMGHMFKQLSIVQGGGFWIGAVGVYTPTSYLTNFLFYREHHETLRWLAVLFFAVVAIVAYLSVKVYRNLVKSQKTWYWLIAVSAIVPVVVLFLISLPPLRSSFVERYLIPAYLMLSLFLGLVLALATKLSSKIHRRLAWLGVGLVVLSMVIGVKYVYEIGNYNKNTNTVIKTKEITENIAHKSSGNEPVLMQSPWLWYEAVSYDRPDQKYYFVDPVDYPYGSMEMLRDNTERKVSEIAELVERNNRFWYVDEVEDDEDVKAPSEQLREIERFSVENPGKNKNFISVLYERID